MSLVGPALKVLPSGKRASRIQQEVPHDANGVPSMHHDIGFAIGNDVSLNYQVGWFKGENTIIMITASRALGFGVDIAVKNFYPVSPRNEHAIPGARADLRILDGDVAGIDNPNTITAGRADFQPLNDGSIATIDDDGPGLG
jgi:hypothetical protein